VDSTEITTVKNIAHWSKVRNLVMLALIGKNVDLFSEIVV